MSNSLATNDSGFITLKSTEAAEVAAYTRVKRSGAGFAIAVLADRGIGHTMQAVGVDDYGAVRLNNQPGITIGIASEAIVVGDVVYSAAAGKVSKTATSAVRLGIADTAASGDGVLFRYIPD